MKNINSHSYSLLAVNCDSDFKRIYIKRWIAVAIILIATISSVLGATRYSVATGNWSSTGTWSTSSGGGSGASVPGINDVVIIERGYTVTVNGTYSCTSLQVGSPGNSNFGAMTFSGTTPSLTVTGAVQLGGYGNTARTGTITFTSASTLTAASVTLGNSGGTPAAGILTMTAGGTLTTGSLNVNTVTGNSWTPGAGTVILNSNNTLPSTIFTAFNNLIINGGTTTSSGVALTINNNLTVTQGNLILQATNASYTVANDLTISTNGILTHSVNWDTYSMLLSVGGNIVIDGIFDYTVRSHVQMTSTGTKTVKTGSNASSSFSILTLSTGTFNANGTLRVDDNFWAMFNTTGAFHTNGQTVTALAGILNAGGTFYIDGGTLNVTAGLSVGAGSLNGAVIFSSGTLNADAINLGDGTRTGTFSQTGGTTNLSGYLLIRPSCSFTCTNSPLINIAGDWTNNGTYTKATETVAFNGTANQTIGGSNSTSFNNLTVNNTAGITLGKDATVSGTLAFTNGKITTGANNLILGTAASVTGAAAGKYVYGNLRWSVPNAATPSKTLTIGDATNYTPVLIAFAGTTTGSGNITAFTVGTEDPNIGSSSIDPAEDVNRYWSLVNSGVAGFTSYDATFNFVASDVDGGANTAEFAVGKYSGSWTYPTVGARTSTSTQATGITSFSTFAVGRPKFPPIVSSHPSNQTVCEGSTATFTAQSTGGNPAPTAKWQISTGGPFSDLTIASPYSVSTNTASGTTTSTLTINPTPYSYNNYQYRVMFTNTYGYAISNGATLTVDPTSVGGSVTGGTTPICLGSSTGTMTLSGHTGSVTKWQKQLNGGSWTDIANTSITYSETPSSAGTWAYRAVVQSGVCSVVNSNAASIVVNTRPTSVLSGSATVCSGQSATLSVALTGTGPWSLTYTDGTTPVAVSSIASSPYTFAVTPASTKTYTVTALSDASCTAQAGDMTGSATVTINTACQVVTLTQPTQLSAVISGTTTVNCGDQAAITVTFTGGTAPYTVTYNSIPHTGASPITFNVLPSATTTYDGTNLIITDSHSCGSSTSGNAVITVTPLPAPVATDATSVTTSSFSANWNASSGATGYRLDVSTASDFSSFVSGFNNLDVSLVTTYPVSGLSSGVLYHFRVRAYNATCTSANSNTKSVTTTGVTISAPAVSSPPFTVDCSTSATGSISFTHGTFNGGNVFTAQLSDNTGSFSLSTNIGSGSSSPISITIPANTPAGSNSYKIRVVSSDPVVTGSESSTFTIINNPCTPIYRSHQSGDWNVPATWDISINGGSTWNQSTSTTPSSTDGTITIRSPHTVTITAVVTVDQVTVETGGTLNNSYNSSFDFYLKLANGAGDDLTVNGTLIANDFIENNTSASIVFGANSNYIHNLVLGKKSPGQNTTTTEIPTATWNITSTCEIQAVMNVPVDGISQDFGNLTWNYTAQPFDIDLAGALTEVKGNFTIVSTGGNKLQSIPTSSRATMHVGGALDIQTGTKLELGPLQNLTVTGNSTLADAECLTLLSSDAGTASYIDNGTISGSGTARIERYFAKYEAVEDYKFHFLSSPVGSAQAIQPEFSDPPNMALTDFYKWDEPSNLWINFRGATTTSVNTSFGDGFNFVAGKGYLVAYPENLVKTFIGKPYTNQSGLVVTCTKLSGGWNLIGNPFPSAIDWENITNNSLLGDNMYKALYYYDNASANYMYYIDVTSGLGTASRYIPAMQGFMVYSDANTLNTVTLKNSSRSHLGQDIYYKNAATLTSNILNLKVVGNNYSDYTRVCFYDPATMNFDGDFDAYKLFSYNAKVPQIYTVTPDNTNVAINTLPVTQMYGTVPLNFYVGVSGTYTLTADGIGSFPSTMYIKLEDKLTGVVQKLNDNPVYTFNSVPGENASRFVLHFQDATSVADPEKNDDFSVYGNNGVLNVIALKAVNGQVNVIDMAGRKVGTASLVSGSVTRIDMKGHFGAYIVNIITNEGVVNKKVVVN